MEKMKELEAAVAQKFLAARSNFHAVHALDLQRWAMAEARELGLPFVASNNWCKLFKKKNRIVSRKITKFVSNVNIRDRDTIERSSTEFVEKMRQAMPNYEKNQIFNADQSGK